jgi:hypothetical protein
MNLKSESIKTLRTYRRLPGSTGPAKIGSAWPNYADEYGKTVVLFDTTGRIVRTEHHNRLPVLPTQADMTDAERFTGWVAELNEEQRRLIWLYADIRSSKRVTFASYCRKHAKKNHKLRREINKAFQSLAGIVRSKAGVIRTDPVAINEEIGEKASSSASVTHWRDGFKLKATPATQVDFTKYMKRA